MKRRDDMITLANYQPMNMTGPYRRKVSRLERVSDALGIIAIGVLLAVSFLGMTGALS
jgi:hypothetical protein